MKFMPIKHHLLPLLFFCYISPPAIGEVKPKVEINHWWSSVSELSALDVLRQDILKKGGEFEAVKVDRRKYIREIIEQSSLGYLPGASHWLGGKETVGLKEKGILSFIPNQIDGKNLSEILHKEVYRDITHQGDILSLPVGIHLQNMAYYNKKIYDKLNLHPPKSWVEFIKQAELIKKAGYTPLALPRVPWQTRNIIDSIIIGLKGSDVFQHIYDDTKTIKPLREELIEVFQFYLSLKQYTNQEYIDYKWFENIHALAQGDVAAYFLGDYSTGELVAKEKLVPGQDFYCQLAPGNEGVHVYGIDTFILFKTTNDAIKQGNNLLVETVLDPSIQANYIKRKGGIPVRQDVKLNSLDACSKTVYEAWLSPNTQRIPYGAGHSKARLIVLQTTAVELWQQENPDVPAAIDNMIKAFNHLI